MDVLKICNIKITAEPENVNSIAQAFRAESFTISRMIKKG